MQQLKTLGQVLFQARKAKYLRQLDVAHVLKVERQRVSEFERDICGPNDRERPLLAGVLDLSESLIMQLQFVDRTPERGTAQLLCKRRKRYEPPCDRDPNTRVFALRRFDRGLFNTLLGCLQRAGNWKEVRRFLLTAPLESRDEVLVLVRQLLYGLKPARLAPLRCGFRARPVIDPRSGEVVGDCPVPALSGTFQGHTCVLILQVAMLVGFEQPRVDLLVGVAVEGTVRWGCAEVDGDGHVFAGDEERTRMLRLPVLRVPGRAAQKPGFAEAMWRQVFQLLHIPLEP